jgi:hypothetical protein
MHEPGWSSIFLMHVYERYENAPGGGGRHVGTHQAVVAAREFNMIVKKNYRKRGRIFREELFSVHMYCYCMKLREDLPYFFAA